MKFLKSALAALILAATTCCAPAARVAVVGPPTKEDAATTLRASTVGLVTDDSLEAEAAYCSGVWVSETSILTAYHCMDDAEVGAPIAYVIDGDIYEKGKPFVRAKLEKRPAVLYDVDKGHDLALLRAGKAPVHATALLASSMPRPGQFVQVMGQSDGFLWWSYSSGDVAAVRNLPMSEELDKDTVFIQTTAPISPGNSGGGLFDANGDLIGICHGHFPRGENLNLFIHTIHLQAFLDAQGTAL